MGKAEWPLHPGPPRKKIARRAREPQEQAGSARPSLRSGLRLIRALPGEPAFATVIGTKPLEPRDNLAPAWARQDHTTSPSANAPLISRHIPRPPHSAPRS